MSNVSYPVEANISMDCTINKCVVYDVAKAGIINAKKTIERQQPIRPNHGKLLTQLAGIINESQGTS